MLGLQSRHQQGLLGLREGGMQLEYQEYRQCQQAARAQLAPGRGRHGLICGKDLNATTAPENRMLSCRPDRSHRH